MTQNNFIFIAILILINACDSEKSFISNDIEKKPEPTAIQSENQSLEVAQIAPKIVDAIYDIDLTDEVGNTFCTGEIGLQILSDLTIKVDEPVVECLGLGFDLTRILNSETLSKGFDTNNKEGLEGLADSFSHDGSLLYIRELSGVSFSPERPFFVGPLIADHGKYEDLVQDFSSTATWTDDLGNVQTSSGSFHLEVTEHLTSYTTPQETLDRIIHWHITSDGFNGLPALKGLTFKKFEWWWNSAPIMIPKFSIVTDPSSLILGDSLDNLFNDLTLTLTIKSYKIED